AITKSWKPACRRGFWVTRQTASTGRPTAWPDTTITSKPVRSSWRARSHATCGSTMATRSSPHSVRWAASAANSSNHPSPTPRSPPMAMPPRPSFKTLFTDEAKTQRNRAAAGMFLSSEDAGIAEIAAGAGMDYLLIDAEHSPMSLESVQNQLRAIAGYDSIPVVRIPENNTTLIKQYLDL